MADCFFWKPSLQFVFLLQKHVAKRSLAWQDPLNFCKKILALSLWPLLSKPLSHPQRLHYHHHKRKLFYFYTFLQTPRGPMSIYERRVQSSKLSITLRFGLSNLHAKIASLLFRPHTGQFSYLIQRKSVKIRTSETVSQEQCLGKLH